MKEGQVPRGKYSLPPCIIPSRCRLFSTRNAFGDFVGEFKPRLLTYLDYNNEHTDDYVEGSPLQWRWALFLNGDGPVSLFRNKEYFTEELNSFFEHSDPALESFYPVAGSDIYKLGALVFSRAEIRTAGGIFTITAENQAPGIMYVKRVWLNDKPMDRFWIRHSEISSEGSLKFEMSDKPGLPD